jgi:hypothetical protein
MGLAATAPNFQSALHRGKMGATRDEGDIGARLSEGHAKSASDGVDNRNSMESPPTR